MQRGVFGAIYLGLIWSGGAISYVLICNIEICLWGKDMERSEYAVESVITEHVKRGRTGDGGRTDGGRGRVAKRQKIHMRRTKAHPHP